MSPRAAGLLIFRHFENRIEYLLLKASYGIKHWSPPKGHVDPGEDDWQTALRETKEEAGLSEFDLYIYKDITKTINYVVKGKNKSVVYWLAKIRNPLKEIKLSNEHTDLKWLEHLEAKNLASFKEFNDMLDYFHQHTLKLSE